MSLRQLVPPVTVLILMASVLASLLTGWPWLAIAAVGGYMTVVLGAGVQAAGEVRSAPALALALATMHLSWGLGFLLGPPRR